MSKEKKEEVRRYLARLPVSLLGQLHRRAGEMSEDRGRYVSVNALIGELLEEALPKSEGVSRAEKVYTKWQQAEPEEIPSEHAELAEIASALRRGLQRDDKGNVKVRETRRQLLQWAYVEKLAGGDLPQEVEDWIEPAKKELIRLHIEGGYSTLQKEGIACWSCGRRRVQRKIGVCANCMKHFREDKQREKLEIKKRGVSQEPMNLWANLGTDLERFNRSVEKALEQENPPRITKEMAHLMYSLGRHYSQLIESLLQIVKQDFCPT